MIEFASFFRNIVIDIHPEPVPISKILFILIFFFSNKSMMVSVSGLGINTLSFTKNHSHRNLLYLKYIERVHL